MKGTLKHNIQFEWFLGDLDYIPPAHFEALKEDAIERIQHMMAEGYTSGELSTGVRYGKDVVPEEDEKSGIEYHGFWKTHSFEESDAAKLLRRFLHAVPEKDWDGWEDSSQARQMDGLIRDAEELLGENRLPDEE